MNHYDNDYTDKAYRGKHSVQRPPSASASPSPSPASAYDRERYSRASWEDPRPSAARGGQGAPGSHPPVAGYDYQAFDRELERRKLQRKRSSRNRKIVVALAAVIVAIGVASAAYLGYVSSLMELDAAGKVDDTLTEQALDEPFYMLLVGSDWREDSNITSSPSMSGDQQRADIMMLARVDRAGQKVTLLTIPRDTPYRNADGSYMKLNEVYNQGRGSALVPAVEDVAGVRISHYAEIYFSDFENLVDALGGIDVNVPMDFSGTDMLTGEHVSVSAGAQTINGAQAGLLARERHIYGGDQDANRQSTIRSLVEAMAAKARKATPDRYPGIVVGAASCIRTDLSSMELIYLLSGLYDNLTMYSGTAPHAGAQDEAAGGLWLCYEDPEGWTRVMSVVDSGADPSDVSYSGDLVTIAGTDDSFILD